MVTTFSRTTGRRKLRGCSVRRKRVSGSISASLIWLGGIPCPGSPARINVDQLLIVTCRQAAANRRTQFPAVAVRAVASRAAAFKDDTPGVGILCRER